MVFNRDGSRKRRKGLTTVNGAENPISVSSNVAPDSVDIIPWNRAGLFQKEDLWVIRQGSDWDIYENEEGRLGAKLNIGSSSLEFPATGPIKSFAVNGDLVVWGGQIEQVFKDLPTAGGDVSYNRQAWDTYSFVELRPLSGVSKDRTLPVEVRDYWGIDDGTDISRTIPYTLPAFEDGYEGTIDVLTPDELSRWYNLTNAGWSRNMRVSDVSSPQNTEQPDPYPVPWYVANFTTFDTTDLNNGPEGWPALSNPFWAHVTDSLQYKGTGSRSGFTIASTAFLMDEYLNADGDYNTDPVKGKFVIDPFNRSASRAYAFDFIGQPAFWDYPLLYTAFDSSDVFWLDNDEADFVDSATFAGRLWVAYDVKRSVGELTGVENVKTNPDIDTLIFYSQTLTSNEKLFKCSAANDPTGDQFNEPLDTDGGYVSIPEVEKIQKLITFGDALFVFATNGVWQISGGEVTFSATSQKVAKISNIGTRSPNSVVSSKDSIFYWGDAGIYRIAIDPVSLTGEAANLTDYTIQDIFYGFAEGARDTCEGGYDTAGSLVRWLVSNASEVPYKDTEVVFDELTGAFTVNSFEATLADTFSDGKVRTCPMPVKYHQTKYVVDGAEGDRQSSLLYIGVSDNLTDRTQELHLLEASNEDFVDFSEWGNGTDAEAYILTGFLTGGDNQRDKQMPYVTTSFKRTEDGFEEDGGVWVATNPSGCLMQTQWEWSNNVKSNKWGREQQTYRFKRPYVPVDPATDDFSNYGFEVINTRTKVRGIGKAVSLLFKSEPKKEMHMYGWSADVSASASA